MRRATNVTLAESRISTIEHRDEHRLSNSITKSTSSDIEVSFIQDDSGRSNRTTVRYLI